MANRQRRVIGLPMRSLGHIGKSVILGTDNATGRNDPNLIGKFSSQGKVGFSVEVCDSEPVSGKSHRAPLWEPSVNTLEYLPDALGVPRHVVFLQNRTDPALGGHRWNRTIDRHGELESDPLLRTVSSPPSGVPECSFCSPLFHAENAAKSIRRAASLLQPRVSRARKDGPPASYGRRPMAVIRRPSRSGWRRRC